MLSVLHCIECDIIGCSYCLSILSELGHHMKPKFTFFAIPNINYNKSFWLLQRFAYI